MASTSFDLTGRRAMVTGASRGIGQAIAHALAKAGCDVAISARKIENLAETAGLIEKEGRRAATVAQDVRDPTDAAGGVEAAADQLGGLDILINNAGFEHVSPSLHVDQALWDSIVDTNLKGAFFAAQAAGRIMAKAGSGGSIVNLCSLTSYVGVPTAVPYGASKSGLLGMTRALATEWAERGIRVNAIAPGYFRTAMTEVFYEDKEWQQRMLSRIPQRRFGEESDVGGVVIFLCSNAAAYVTGHCIPVDGGYLASV
ncbi:SDR family NAD(P)-dependent oxidoreductase [Oryzicola mucosus]|uniref:Glucose 1-dehydrogenase n=1 Tax=Oryzicola mucosus TaxID=2767425 RepID=A0A8J6PL11_9HYPH|nr:glucose 1-dehydrogenase [Oryzicola mucosus]MBD0415551.1 glucose 1-dehydrogenase [Oryzicola mucosus]